MVRAGQGKDKDQVAAFEPVREEYVQALEASVCPDDFDAVPPRVLADGVARSDGDRQLIEHLARTGFSGPAQVAFEAELAAYGYPVMMAWTRTGEIIRRVSQLGRPLGVGADGPGWSRDDRSELCAETVARALDFFRTAVLAAGQWDSTRGASVKSYYIGACLFQFPNVYRRWDGERRRWQASAVMTLDDPADPAGLSLVPGPDDPAATAMTTAALEQVLADLAGKDPVLHRVATLRLAGYTDAEAAALLGLSARSVEGRWYRFSKNLRRRYDEAGSA